MTVFKCYMKILKNNIGLVSIYLVIFFSIAMALQASAKKDHLEDFEKTRIDLAIADQDDSTLSHALTDYLKTIHNVYEISAEPTVMQGGEAHEHLAAGHPLPRVLERRTYALLALLDGIVRQSPRIKFYFF